MKKTSSISKDVSSTPGTDEISDLLWHDNSIVPHRYRKSAASLTAVATLIEQRGLLGGAESHFLNGYRRLAASTTPALNHLWSEPFVYYWVRVAFELTHAIANEAPVPPLAQSVCAESGLDGLQENLAFHLKKVDLLLLSAAIMEDKDLDLDAPLKVEAPFAIPATRATVIGNGTLEIAGIHDGHLLINLEYGEQKGFSLQADRVRINNSAELMQCPEVRFEGCTIRLQPPVLNIPVNSISQHIHKTSLEFQEQHKHRVLAALKNLKSTSPEVFRQFAEIVRVIILHQPVEDGQAINVSHGDLPGLMAVYPFHNPVDFANVLIHEFHHSRLFFVEESAGFLIDPDTSESERIYSPWRDDLRPLHGLFHAAFVFTAVLKYWLKIYEGNDPADMRDIARARIIRADLQIRMGISQLSNARSLSSFGLKVLEQLRRDEADLRATMARVGIPPDAPYISINRADGSRYEHREPGTSRLQTVRDVLKLHLHQFANPDEVNRLAGIL